MLQNPEIYCFYFYVGTELNRGQMKLGTLGAFPWEAAAANGTYEYL